MLDLRTVRRRREYGLHTPGGLEVVLTIAAIAVAGILAVLWMMIQRALGVREERRPREDADLQLHQAQRNGGGGFGP